MLIIHDCSRSSPHIPRGSVPPTKSAFHRLLDCLHEWELTSEQVNQGNARQKPQVLLYDLPLIVLCPHFCYILFVASESLNTAHVPWPV